MLEQNSASTLSQQQNQIYFSRHFLCVKYPSLLYLLAVAMSPEKTNITEGDLLFLAINYYKPEERPCKRHELLTEKVYLVCNHSHRVYRTFEKKA